MESTQIKKAYRDAEQEHEKEKVEGLKKVIRATLEKLEALKEERVEYLAKIDKKIDTLKRDIDDFKAGRLDRINERQEKDKEAKATSVVEVVKHIESINFYGKPWYEPYQLIWVSAPYGNGMYVTSSSGSVTSTTTTSSNALGYLSATGNSNSASSGSFTLTGQLASVYSAGAYQLENGTVKNI